MVAYVSARATTLKSPAAMRVCTNASASVAVMASAIATPVVTCVPWALSEPESGRLPAVGAELPCMGPARLHVCDCVASMRPPRAMEPDLEPMAAEDARSFWIAEPGRGEIRAEPLRGAEPGDAVV